MAEKKVVVKVTSSGLKETTAEAQKLNKELDKVEKKRKVSTTGSRAADAALLSSDKQISTGLGRGTAASMARGDSRDFARQAQGLGGLVHVYATFAANVFAVAAAFNALSKAMDFELMVRAAEEMSTRVGTSLSNVANDIYTLTDAAVSLKDAFAAGNLAANAGLTTDQIQGLAKAAKGASLAMGRDMTDSLNRIFRGTIKIEPELLDELGIMVKVNEVNKDYAKSVGKSVLALTDFERRQAFVNGVLEQAEEKYSTLANAQANAFSQLQSSIINLTTSLGILINTALGPVVSVLASSPTALIMLMGSLVALLVKQAIPAIKDMSKAQLESLKDAEAVYKRQKELLAKRIVDIKEANKAALSARQTELAKPFEDAAQKIGGKLGDAIRSLTSTASDQVTTELEKINKKLESTGKATDTRLKKLQDLKTEFEKTKEPQAYGRQVFGSTDDFDRAIQKAKDTRSAIEGLQSSMKDLSTAAIAHNTNMETASKSIDELEKATKTADKAAKSFGATRHRMNAVMIAEFASVREAIKSLFTEFEYGDKGTKATLNTLQKFRGVLSVLTASAARLISAFSIWGAVIAIATVAIIGFLKWTGQLTDKSSKFNDSFNKSQENIKSFQASLDKLAKAGTVEARFNSLTASLKLQIDTINSMRDSYEDLMTLLNKGTTFEKGWEKFKDSFIFTDSDKEKFAKSLEGLYNTSTNKKAIDQAIQLEFKDTKNLAGEALLVPINNLEKALAFAKHTGDVDILKRVFTLMDGMDLERMEKSAFALQNISNTTGTLNDNAKEYVNNLTKANKEYDSANAILSNTISILDTLSSGNVEEFASALMHTIDSINNAATIAYTQTQGSFDGLIAASEEIRKLQDEIANAKDPKTKDEKSKELSTLINKKAPSVLREFLDYADKASDSLYRLGQQASINAVQIAKLNRTDRLKDFYGAIIGAPKGSEDLRSNNRMIEIQKAQLRVQIGMLKTMHEQQRVEAQTDPNYLKKLAAAKEAKTPLTEDMLITSLETAIGVASQYKKTEDIPENVKTAIMETAAALSAVRKIRLNESSEKAALAEASLAIKALSMEEATANQIEMADKGALNQLQKEAAEAGDSLNQFNRANELVNRHMLGTALGLGDLNSRLDALSESYIKAREDLTRSRNEQQLDVARKQEAALLKSQDVGKEYTAAERAKDTEYIKTAQIRLDEANAKLNNVDIDRNAKEFEIRLAEYKNAVSILETISIDFIGALSEQVEYDLTDMDRINEAVGSTRMLLQNINFDMIEAEKLLEREVWLYNERLKVVQSEEDYLVASNELLKARLSYQSKITAAIDQYVEKYALLRELQMKEAERSDKHGKDYLDVIFSDANIRRFGEQFITAIDEGLANLRPWMAQLADSFAVVINDTIDLTLDLFQTAELTWESFIHGTRNLLSDMFKDLASNQLKKAIGEATKQLTVKLIGPDAAGKLLNSDQDLKEELRNTYLGKNTTALESNIGEMQELKLTISKLTDAINGKLVNHPLFADSKVKPQELPKIPESAETFALEPTESLNATVLDTQTDFVNKVFIPMATSAETMAEKIKAHADAADAAIQRLRDAGITQEETARITEERLKQLQTPKALDKELILEPDEKISNGFETGMFTFTSNIEEGSSGLDEYTAQILRNEEVLRGASDAATDHTNLVKSSTILLDQYNKDHQEIMKSLESTVTSFEKLQAAISATVDKMYEAITTKPTIGSPENSKAIMDAFNASQGPIGLPEDGLTQEQWDAANLMKDAAYTQSTSASTVAEQVAQDTLNTGKFGNVVTSFFNVEKGFDFAISKLIGALGGSSGEFNLFETILSVGAKSLLGGISGLFTSSYTPFAGTATEGMSNFSTMSFDDIGAFSTKFAKGGIMTPYGALELQKYATGGIASSPQAAIFGEGSMNEAFVPLPDGKSIPVSLSNTMPAGDTNISIQVNIESNGKQDTKVQSDAGTKFSKQLASAVKATIQEELIKQQRPGGLLYR